MRYNPISSSALLDVQQPVQQPAEATPQPQAQTAAPQAKPVGLKKVSLGGIKQKTEAAPTSDYPTLPDPDGKLSELAARIAERQAQLEAIEGALKTDKAELARVHCRPFWIRHHHGKTGEIPSS